MCYRAQLDCTALQMGCSNCWQGFSLCQLQIKSYRAWIQSAWLLPCYTAFSCSIIEGRALAIADSGILVDFFFYYQHNKIFMMHLLNHHFLYYACFILHLLTQLTIRIWHFMIKSTSYHITLI